MRAPDRAGVLAPKLQNATFRIGAPVAQLDRVPGYEPGGREFESLRARQLQRVLSGHIADAYSSNTPDTLARRGDLEQPFGNQIERAATVSQQVAQRYRQRARFAGVDLPVHCVLSPVVIANAKRPGRYRHGALPEPIATGRSSFASLLSSRPVVPIAPSLSSQTVERHDGLAWGRYGRGRLQSADAQPFADSVVRVRAIYSLSKRIGQDSCARSSPQAF
jgi:hypothetical protein